MSHLTDARDILFADPADMDTASYVSDVSLNDQIEHAEWHVEAALDNLNACVSDEEIDHAAFYLKCAIARMNGLCERREARDRESQRQQTENWVLFPVHLLTASGKQDEATAEGDASHG